MFERFSEEALDALALMQRTAADMALLGNSDLLVALARLGRGVASEVLAGAELVPVSTSATLGPRSGNAAARTGDDLRTTLLRADEIRRLHAQDLVTTGHLLLALADADVQPDPLVAPWWRRLATDLNAGMLGRRTEDPPLSGLLRHRRAVFTGTIARAAPPAVNRRQN